MDHAQAYERAHQRILPLLNQKTQHVEVPTCPGWTVKDVVAHLASFFPVARSGDPKEAFGPGWGDEEVKARSDLSLEECISEWNKHLESSGDIFESHLGGVAVSDVLAHEQDIRTALDEPGGMDDENIVPAVEMALSFLEQKLKSAGLPAMRVVTDDIDRQVGEGEPQATLRASTFELFRAIQGRRTPDQVREMDWDGDPGPWMEAFFIFGPTERQVEASSTS